MTLVLTELSDAGIAMAADSAITKMSRGKIIEVDEQGWSKLLRVPSIKAGISYWGVIGAVTSNRFDTWLQRVINAGGYTDLNSFADHLVDALNNACRKQPLAQGQDIGVHVAGYADWPDGEQRPFFFHVHNGHGRMGIQTEINEHGQIVAVHPRWISDPRKLFEKHQDFPDKSKSIEENLQILRGGYITRNGSYLLYAIMWEQLRRALHQINIIHNVSIPRDPSRISSRKGFLHIMLEMMIQLYKCSNQSRIVGGKVSSLGIGPEGYVR